MPKSLRGSLRAILAKTQPSAKPWLHWPVTWEEISESEDQKVLRKYLTSPDIHRERLAEVSSIDKAHLFACFVEPLLFCRV